MLLNAIVGLLTVSATVLLHAAGTAWWLQRLRSRSRSSAVDVKRSVVLSVLVQTALVLITLHVLEVFLWAVTFRVSTW